MQYPIFLILEGRRCVVVGGGRIALAKAQPLHAAGARVAVVSPEFAPGFDALEAIERVGRPFAPGDLDGAFLAVAATDNPAVNGAVADACRARGILCNVVDAPERCDFFVPAVVERGPLVAAVSTSGEAPALAKRLRAELEALWPEDYAVYTRFLGEARRRARACVPDPAERERIAAALASRDGYNRFKETAPADREAWLAELLGQAETGDTGP